MLTPYRAPSEPADHQAAAANPERELVPAYAVLWIACAARVGGALLRGESFDAEISLAALSLTIVPLLVCRLGGVKKA